MSQAPVEVRDWIREAEVFEPTMTATVGTAPEEVLEALAAGLTSQGYKVKDRTATGFRASHRDVLRGVLGLVTANDGSILERTLILVSVAPGGPGATLATVTVDQGGERRSGRKAAVSGLNAALQDLQRRGVPVSTTPWVKG